MPPPPTPPPPIPPPPPIMPPMARGQPKASVAAPEPGGPVKRPAKNPPMKIPTARSAVRITAKIHLVFILASISDRSLASTKMIFADHEDCMNSVPSVLLLRACNQAEWPGRPPTTVTACRGAVKVRRAGLSLSAQGGGSHTLLKQSGYHCTTLRRENGHDAPEQMDPWHRARRSDQPGSHRIVPTWRQLCRAARSAFRPIRLAGARPARWPDHGRHRRDGGRDHRLAARAHLSGRQADRASPGAGAVLTGRRRQRRISRLVGIADKKG